MSGKQRDPLRIVTSDGRGLSNADHEDKMRTEAEELIGRIATEVWRLARRFSRIAEGQEVRPVGDSVARLHDTLRQYGVELQEHDGQAYDDGLRVEVLAGLEPDLRLIVAETIEPSIRWKGRVIRQGKVTLKRAEE